MDRETSGLALVARKQKRLQGGVGALPLVDEGMCHHPRAGQMLMAAVINNSSVESSKCVSKGTHTSGNDCSRSNT
jgi:hypothetical protein